MAVVVWQEVQVQNGKRVLSPDPPQPPQPLQPLQEEVRIGMQLVAYSGANRALGFLNFLKSTGPNRHFWSTFDPLFLTHIQKNYEKRES